MSDLVRNSINIMSGTTARSITKDITPIINWCEEENKQLYELPFTDGNDNPDTGTLTLSGAIDISNMFRDSLKPCFKLLTEKVNELETEFDNYPTVDKTNEALKEYALKKDIPEPVDMSGYATTTECDNKYVAKNELFSITIHFVNGSMVSIKERIS